MSTCKFNEMCIIDKCVSCRTNTRSITEHELSSGQCPLFPTISPIFEHEKFSSHYHLTTTKGRAPVADQVWGLTESDWGNEEIYQMSHLKWSNAILCLTRSYSEVVIAPIHRMWLIWVCCNNSWLSQGLLFVLQLVPFLIQFTDNPSRLKKRVFTIS